MSDLHDASESRFGAAHRHLTETDPLYRISSVTAPVALVVAIVAVTVWPGAAPLPPPAVPVAPPPGAPAPQPQSPASPPASGSVQLGGLRDRAVSDFSALIDLRKRADEGSAEAEFYMGTLYDPTLTQLPFANKDISVSFDWYRKSGEHGFAAAELTLGQSYQIGWGVAQNDTKAAEWYLKAAQQGVPLAQNQIGWMTAHGQGVDKNCAVAKNWFEDAKAGGYARAEENLRSGATGACQW